MPSKVTEPVSPYMKDMPYSRMAVDSTPRMKNFSEASLDLASPFRHPASRNRGPVTSSRPTNRVIRSLDDAITSEPRIDVSISR